MISISPFIKIKKKKKFYGKILMSGKGSAPSYIETFSLSALYLIVHNPWDVPLDRI